MLHEVRLWENGPSDLVEICHHLTSDKKISMIQITICDFGCPPPPLDPYPHLQSIKYVPIQIDNHYAKILPMRVVNNIH